ncbi:MAG: DNA mismatch repair endonuclease MutL [Bacteroidales bacterium]|nr:DNA mismatch repair endonuclease MutL [Bacteroidales bacterium]
MSDIIHLLPDSVANQIAAGEVIQRPASVVKELVENAIDAGAKNIQIIITDAGKSVIQVIDDGEGMSDTDARLSFERHATSKIKEAGDLFALRTMGFRGEALASIAAVAQVELKTRREWEELGTLVTIEGSRFVKQELVSCAKGSHFIIKNLFFNVPARRKFLKTNATELNHIINEFERIVLVNPTIGFTFFSNDTLLFDLPASSIKQRIVNVFGKRMNQQLLNVEVETSMVLIHGYIGSPESARKRGAQQFFFANGRYMRHPYFYNAVLDAYKDLIPTDERVPFFLYLDVDPAQIDVNIHPTKTEIKFENEQGIWQILFAALKEALGKFNAVPSIDFNQEDMPDIPVFEDEQSVSFPSINLDRSFNPFQASGQEYTRAPINWKIEDYGMAKSGGTAKKIEKPFFDDEDWDDAVPEKQSCEVNLLYEQEEEDKVKDGAVYLQYKGRYLLTAIKSGLLVIDQHRAHIRVLFDQFIEQIRNQKGVSQGVLFPEIIELTTSEAAILESIREDLTYVGFELSNLGGGSYAINSVPSGTDGLDPVVLVHNMVVTAMEKGSDVKAEIQNRLALVLAKSSAIVYGQVLTSTEVLTLVNALFACKTPNYTPDGLPVLTTWLDEDIAKCFN